MFVVAGVTGNTGAVVAETLLAQGKRVRVLARDEAKGARFAAKGAEVRAARLDDTRSLTEALRGAEGAYLLLPPDYATDAYLASRRRFVDAYLEAIPASGVKHVVFLSSIGAQHAAGTGPIRALHDAEERLGALATPITWVRAAYFLENWASVTPVAKKDGVLPAMFGLDHRIPMVSVQDIGRTAAQALVEGLGGAGVIELSGSVDASPNDVAAALGKVLGRTVTAVRVPDEAQVGALQGAGLTTDLAGLFAEMNAGIESGRVEWQHARARQVRGRAALEDVLRRLVG